MKSHFVPHSELHPPPPSNGVRSLAAEAPEGAGAPDGFDLCLWLPRADSPPGFHLSDTRFPVFPSRQPHLYFEHLHAALRDGIDLGRVSYKHKLIKTA